MMCLFSQAPAVWLPVTLANDNPGFVLNETLLEPKAEWNTFLSWVLEKHFTLSHTPPHRHTYTFYNFLDFLILSSFLLLVDLMGSGWKTLQCHACNNHPHTSSHTPPHPPAHTVGLPAAPLPTPSISCCSWVSPTCCQLFTPTHTSEHTELPFLSSLL